MPKLCLNCYEIYDSNLVPSSQECDYAFCPKYSCIGEVVEIDELLLPIIVKLNQKGYYTRYCCSGHYYDNCPNCYIMFDEDVLLPNVPKGFILEEDNTIRRTYKNSGENIFLETLNTIKVLLKWANGLPNVDYEDGDML